MWPLPSPWWSREKKSLQTKGNLELRLVTTSGVTVKSHQLLQEAAPQLTEISNKPP